MSAVYSPGIQHFCKMTETGHLPVVVSTESCALLSEIFFTPGFAGEKGFIMFKIHVMAPLAVQEPGKFLACLDWLANVHPDAAVSVDFWWGIIEPQCGQYNFKYYDWIVRQIVVRRLKVAIIVSLHACGGNIGDDVNIPIPGHVWVDLGKKLGGDPQQAMCVSEYGRVHTGFISPWATHLAIPKITRLFQAIQNHYAACAPYISEIMISTGEAGETRYPSYNEPGCGFGTRGGLQCYSDLAIQSFRQYALQRFGGLPGVRAEWGWNGDASEILPPTNTGVFFARGDYFNTSYGWTLFDWYSDSLLARTRQIMQSAFSVFCHPKAAFFGIEIGAKVPGIHWGIGRRNGDHIQFGDRIPEMLAGLIRPSSGDWFDINAGLGYRPLIQFFARMAACIRPVPFTLHFTCVEMKDGEVTHEIEEGTYINVDCMPETLVTAFTSEAQRNGVSIGGENALEQTLERASSWRTMESHLFMQRCAKLTLLRLEQIVASPVASQSFAELTARVRQHNANNGNRAA